MRPRRGSITLATRMPARVEGPRMDRGARDHWLDVLRGAAVLLVLGRHLWPIEDGPEWFRQLTALWYRGGWVGVDLFFVLSGFLVSGLVFREYQRGGSFSAGRFLARRAFKIYPAFYVLILVTLLVERFTDHPPVTRRTLFAELLFVQNYLGG